MMARHKATCMKFIFCKLEAELIGSPGSLILVYYRFSIVLFDIPWIPSNRNMWFMMGPRLQFIMVHFVIYLFYRDDSLARLEVHHADQTIN